MTTENNELIESKVSELPNDYCEPSSRIDQTDPTGVDENEIDDDKSSSSERSEILRLGNESLSEEDIDCRETPADVAFARNKKHEEAIQRIIETTKSSNSTSLDLSKRDLLTFPDSVLDLSHLEYMYLEGNEIVSLPDEFFRCFPNLRWLDLRNNMLSRIPSVYLSSHTCLRNLLLEGNNLRNLPLELGLVKSLHGLNIAGNPLDFPPQEIIEKGTQYILQFLRDMIDAKNQSKMADLELNLSEEVPDGFEHISASSDDWNTTASMMDIAQRRARMFKSKSSDVSRHENGNHTNESEYVVGAKSAELHRPENKEQHLNKLKKLGALANAKSKKKKMSNMAWKVNRYPTPPPAEYAAFKMNEEKQLAKVKDFRVKTDAILQRRKDETILRNWRDDARLLQRKKYAQQMVPGKDYQEPGEQAPFGVEKEMMKVLSKEERLKADLQREKELKDQRTVSPATRQRIEQEKQERIHELERRIKDHTANMVERRKQPKGTPQHEMEIAKRELEIAEQLHGELLAQRKEIEYRFKAYSADVKTVMHGNKQYLTN